MKAETVLLSVETSVDRESNDVCDGNVEVWNLNIALADKLAIEHGIRAR